MSNETKPSARVYDSKVPPLDWRPEPSAGIRLTTPAAELAAHEYDQIADALIKEHGAGSEEAQKIANARNRGWVIERQGRRVFMKGRG